MCIRDSLVIAGHNEIEAYRFAQSLDTNAHWRFINIEDPTTFDKALEGVTHIVVCMETKSLDLVHACIERGIHYIDITASIEVIDRFKAANELANERGVLLLSSVGLAPGLTSLMAKACVRYSPEPVSSISIHILLGLGERHGKAAVGWMVNRLYQPFWVTTESGKERRTPYVRKSKAQFPDGLGLRNTYQIDFSDQHTILDTLNIPSASTWLTFDAQWVADLMSMTARLGVLQLAKYPFVHRLFVRSLASLSLGSDRFAVSVDAHTETGMRINCSATGFGEARATAIMAAETVRHLLKMSVPDGVRQLEDILELGHFLHTLSEHNIQISAHPVLLKSQIAEQEMKTIYGVNSSNEQHY